MKQYKDEQGHEIEELTPEDISMPRGILVYRRVYASPEEHKTNEKLHVKALKAVLGHR